MIAIALSREQGIAQLRQLRSDRLGELAFPEGAYLYAEPIPMPEIHSSDFLFN